MQLHYDAVYKLSGIVIIITIIISGGGGGGSSSSSGSGSSSGSSNSSSTQIWNENTFQSGDFSETEAFVCIK